MSEETHAAGNHPKAQERQYRICVLGHLKSFWSDWFNAVEIQTVRPHGPEPVSVLHCCMVDQPKLRGILNRLWDMNLTILGVWALDETLADNRDPPFPLCSDP